VYLKKLSKEKDLRDLQDQEILFPCKIANLFGRTFKNYQSYVICDNYDNIITPIVQVPAKSKIYISLPYSWNSFFINPSNGKTMVKNILSHLKPDILRFSFHELPSKDIIEQFNINKFTVKKSESSYLDLSDGFDYIFKSLFSVKTRNQCRKALKSEIFFQITKNENRIIEYFQIYLRTSKNWNSKYMPYPLDFFLALIKENNNVDFWISTYNDKLIAGIITIKYHKRIYYWASMLNRDFSKMCPINGLLYNAIKFYEKNGFNIFDFGPSPEGKGVTHFKKNFGCTKSIFYDITYKSARYKYIIEPLNKLRQ
jgi:hypothetical protein